MDIITLHLNRSPEGAAAAVWLVSVTPALAGWLRVSAAWHASHTAHAMEPDRPHISALQMMMEPDRPQTSALQMMMVHKSPPVHDKAQGYPTPRHRWLMVHA